MGLIQRVLESHGISTVGYTLLREMTRMVRPPRALWVRAPFGRTFGEPGDRERQRALLLEALDALESVPEPGLVLSSALPPVSPEHRRRQLRVRDWEELGRV